ncbi:MAG: YgfZ/GcvT domain-containing protein [Actinomycetales bacterium]
MSTDAAAPTYGPSPLLARPGAVAAEGADAGVAWHYGDPMAEQRRLVEGVGAVDLSHRGVVTVTGPDRLSWLHSLTTQQLTGLAPYSSTESLVLSPHGHVEHDLHLVDDGSTTWVTVEPGTSPALTAWLDSMRFLLRVEVADVTPDFAVVGEPVRREAGPSEPVAWSDPWPLLAQGGAAYSVVSDLDHPGWTMREVIVPRSELASYTDDRELSGTWALEALRVAAWRPRLGHESDHRTIPHEVDWLRTAVHLQKGCYRGQETVARVHNLGRPPRRLVMLHLDGSGHGLPEQGDEVQLDGRRVGFVTTAARHYELGPVALALVKRNTAVDATLQVGDIAAAQEVVVAP